MQNDTVLTEEDEGKAVTSANETIGRVMTVEHGTAYVDPDPSLTDEIRSRLGWGGNDEDTYRLESGNVETITDDEVRIGSNPNPL